MRVAMICNYPVDPKVVPGGVTAVAHYLVKGLGRVNGVDLHVVSCQSDVERARTEERDGATIHFLHDPDRLSLLLRWWPQRRAIARVMRRIRPEIAHAQGLGLPAAAAIDSGLPFVVSLHGILWKEASIHHPSQRKHLRGKLRARAALGQLERTHNVFITSGYAARMLDLAVGDNGASGEYHQASLGPDSPYRPCLEPQPRNRSTRRRNL